MPLLIDLTGQRFGKLVVIERAITGKKRGWWKVRCDCGIEKVVNSQSLRDNKTLSCGCLNAELSSRRSLIDLTGQRFGRYTVLSYHGLKYENAYWNARCDCGVEKVVRGSSLRNGDVVSCGCWKIEKSIKRNTTHGLSKTREYRNYITNKYFEKKHLYDTEWTLEMEQAIRTLFDACVVCGMTNKEHLEKFGTVLYVDHVKPLKNNNGLRPGNATILCHTCNSIKWIHDLEDLPERMRDRILVTADLFDLIWSTSMTTYQDN